MDTPREFLDLTLYFHQDSLENVNSERDWVRGAVAHLKAPDLRRDRVIVQDFVGDILRADKADLASVWNSSRADYHVSDQQGARHLLVLLLDEIRNLQAAGDRDGQSY